MAARRYLDFASLEMTDKRAVVDIKRDRAIPFAFWTLLPTYRKLRPSPAKEVPPVYLGGTPAA